MTRGLTWLTAVIAGSAVGVYGAIALADSLLQ